MIQTTTTGKPHPGGMFPPNPKPEVRVIEAGFGGITVNGPNAGFYPKARLWLLAGPDPNLDDDPVSAEFAVYIPGPAPPGFGSGGLSNDYPARRTYGAPVSAELSSRRWLIHLADGSRASVTVAPCGCGGGRLAQAGPVDGRFQVVMVRSPVWVTRTA